jgi:carboxylesterase type B
MNLKTGEFKGPCARRKHRIGLQCSIFLALLLICVGSTFGVISKGTGGVVVRTTFGAIQGETEGDVLVFRGIRFAEAPVGKLRFRPPVPPAAWGDVKPALDFTPACPQIVEIDPTENNNSLMAEDCLALNVWTPKADSGKRAVRGSKLSGLPAWPKYDTVTRSTMELGTTSRVLNDPLSAQRAVWDEVPFDGVTPSVQKVSWFLSTNSERR